MGNVIDETQIQGKSEEIIENMLSEWKSMCTTPACFQFLLYLNYFYLS